MAGMGNAYDRYNRSLPRVFVGEYAANVGHQRTLRAALAEGIFLLGFERNADVVVATSFAPLLNNLKGTQWYAHAHAAWHKSAIHQPCPLV